MRRGSVLLLQGTSARGVLLCVRRTAVVNTENVMLQNDALHRRRVGSTLGCFIIFKRSFLYIYSLSIYLFLPAEHVTRGYLFCFLVPVAPVEGKVSTQPGGYDISDSDVRQDFKERPPAVVPHDPDLNLPPLLVLCFSLLFATGTAIAARLGLARRREKVWEG